MAVNMRLSDSGNHIHISSQNQQIKKTIKELHKLLSIGDGVENDPSCGQTNRTAEKNVLTKATLSKKVRVELIEQIRKRAFESAKSLDLQKANELLIKTAELGSKRQQQDRLIATRLYIKALRNEAFKHAERRDLDSVFGHLNEAKRLGSQTHNEDLREAKLLYMEASYFKALGGDIEALDTLIQFSNGGEREATHFINTIARSTELIVTAFGEVLLDHLRERKDPQAIEILDELSRKPHKFPEHLKANPFLC